MRWSIIRRRAKGKGRRAVDRGQMSRGQMTEVRGQMTEVRGQKTDDRKGRWEDKEDGRLEPITFKILLDGNVRLTQHFTALPEDTAHFIGAGIRRCLQIQGIALSKVCIV